MGESQQEALLQVFRKYDRNRDGTIDHAKLCWILQRLDPNFFTTQKLDAAIPKNEDGKVMYEEFVNWIFGEDLSKQQMAPPRDSIMSDDEDAVDPEAALYTLNSILDAARDLVSKEKWGLAPERMAGLSVAIASAKDCKLDPGPIAEAESLLQFITIIDNLQSKIDRAEGGAEDGLAEQLQKAIAEAEAAKVADSLISKGRAALTKIEAEDELCDALTNRKALIGAIAKAEQAGVDADVITAAKNKLKGLWAMELYKASEAENIERLQAAILGAKEAGVDNDYIEEANKDLARITADVK